MVRSHHAPTLDPRTVRQIAAAAEGLDPRTVASYLEGRQKTHTATAVVIRQALAKLGLPDPHAPGGAQ
jgi:hypothetical protein